MNPFLINDYISPEYFCDREVETKTLITNILNQSNTAFFAQRRIGKTALIKHLFFLLKQKKYTALYIDIYGSRNLKEFTNQLANAIYQSFPQNKTVARKFLEAIKLLRPIISIDEFTGSPQLSLDISLQRQYEKTIQQLFLFLENQNTKTVIAIDEFQQILNYPEKNIEALLRTAIQPLKNVHFIFCGSHQDMMHTIFNSAKRPFYASSKSINLQKIKPEIYSSFIKKLFEKHKRKISNEAITSILELSHHHTYYTQRLCHDIFASEINKITPQEVLLIANKILIENEGIYFQYRNLLTNMQWNVLKAIAHEQYVYQPYAKSFIFKHQLGTPALVKRSLESLLEKEMIFYNASVEQSYYEVYDKFLLLWLRKMKF